MPEGANSPVVDPTATVSATMPPAVDPNAILTIGQAATLVSRSKRTIYQWIADGLVTVTYTPKGQLRVVAGSLFVDEVPARLAATEKK